MEYGHMINMPFGLCKQMVGCKVSREKNKNKGYYQEDCGTQDIWYEYPIPGQKDVTDKLNSRGILY